MTRRTWHSVQHDTKLSVISHQPTRHPEFYKANRRNIKPCEPVCKAISGSIDKQMLKQYKMSQRGTSCANLYASAVQGDRGCKCRVAFTLSEVLITLTIIGVIAALTIPNLIAKHEKEETVTKLKKVYSTLSQAVGASIAENGPIDSWETPEYGAGSNSSKTNYVVKYVYNYLRVSKKCYTSKGECAKTDKVATNGTGGIWGWPHTPVAILEDGTQIYMTYHSFLDPKYNNALYLGIDINGDKKPNIFGKDVFYFTLDKNGLRAYGAGSSAKRTCKEGVPGAGTSPGLSCAAVIMQDSWQITDDYPFY